MVVGGGVVGLSTAWWLSRLAPDHRVVLLEAGHLAGRASGRNAGFLLTGTPDPFTVLAGELGREAALGLWERSRENRELLRGELLDPGVVDADFLPEGSWLGALPDTGQAAALEASCEELRGEGFELEWWPEGRLREVSGGARLAGAVHQPRDGGLDPVQLCRGLAATGGFEVRTGCRVHALEADGDRVRVVADGGDHLAPRVAVALNAYAPVLLPHLAGAVRPVRGQMLATAPGERSLRGVWYLNDGHEYLRQAADGTVVLGGAREVAEAEEVGYLEAPTARVQGALDDFLPATFPALAGRAVVRRWAGTMAFTDGGLPLAGEVPEIPGARYLAGMNGHGMSLGFVAGRHLAEHLLDREPGELIPGARSTPPAGDPS